jgi:hypothetical protein
MPEEAIKLEVEMRVKVYLFEKTTIDATESEIRELYELDPEDSVEDYLRDYVSVHRFEEVNDQVDLDDLNSMEMETPENGQVMEVTRRAINA